MKRTFYASRASLVAQMVKCLSAMQETSVRSLGWEDPLEKEMAAHSSTLAWRIPWTEATVLGVVKSWAEWCHFHFLCFKQDKFCLWWYLVTLSEQRPSYAPYCDTGNIFTQELEIFFANSFDQSIQITVNPLHTNMFCSESTFIKSNLFISPAKLA